MFRPNRHLVVATERLPAQFRPSNQALLVPGRSANPSVSSPADFMPMGQVRVANGAGDNGLSTPRTLARFQSALNAVARARASKIQKTGVPTALPSSTVSYYDFQGAASAMPAAPGSGKKLVAQIPRTNNSSWRIYSWDRYGKQVFEAELSKDGDVVLESGIMDTEADARNYILAQQFARVNIDHLQPKRGAAFQRALMQATSPHANAAGAMVRNSLLVPDDEGEQSPVDGLSTTGAASIGALVVGVAVLFTIFRR